MSNLLFLFFLQPQTLLAPLRSVETLIAEPTLVSIFKVKIWI